jgi:DNA mismatch endonuclease, patch repair protein
VSLTASRSSAFQGRDGVASEINANVVARSCRMATQHGFSFTRRLVTSQDQDGSGRCPIQPQNTASNTRHMQSDSVCPVRVARVAAPPPRSAEKPIPFKRGAGVTTAGRSKLMARVRQARTGPEDVVAAWLRAHNFGYRRNVRTLAGRPDFANCRLGFAIFVHGCFWHRHLGCARATTPSRNRDFWLAKFAANLERDAARMAELEGAGLRVIIVWECETKDPTALETKLGPLLDRVGR